MNEICKLYQNALEAGGKGTHVVSTDEMTGIQALEHKYPDKLPQPGQCAKMEFEYIRHGTTSLTGLVDPEWRDFWRNAYASVLPGYHQNKNHWNTVILDGTIPTHEIQRMIAESYDLVV